MTETMTTPHMMTEAQMQRGLIDLLTQLGFRVYHTRYSIGSHPGFPDIFAVDDLGQIIALEVKGPRGRIRPEQEAWIDDLERNGDCLLAAVVGPETTDRWMGYDDALNRIREEVTA